MKVFPILAVAALAPHVQGFGDTPDNIWVGTGCDWYGTNDYTSEEFEIETFTGNTPESCLEAAREIGCEIANSYYGECWCQFGSIDESAHPPCTGILPDFTIDDAVCSCQISPPASEIDICGTTCEELVTYEGVPCTATWEEGCDDIVPPQGFSAYSTLGEMCPTECVAASEIDLCGNTCAEVITEFGVPCTSTWEEGCDDMVPPQGFSAYSTLGEMCPTECEGFSPSQPFGNFDIGCGWDCEALDEVFALFALNHCDLTWEQICDDYPEATPWEHAPEGFSRESMIYEMCPEGECMYNTGTGGS